MTALHPTKKIEAIAPHYAQKFVCVGSSCEDTCCAGWGVVIDKKTYSAYQKVKSPTLTPRLTHEIGRVRSLATDQNYARVKMSAVNQACPMLEDSLCAIQKELGEDKLSNTCSTFPRFSYRTGDFYQQSLTLSCPEAARLALLEDDAFEFSSADFYVRPDTVSDLKPKFGLRIDEMNEVRFFCIKIIKLDGLTLWQKMIFLGLVCESLTASNKQSSKQNALEKTQGLFQLLESGELGELFENINANHELQAEIFVKLWAFKTGNQTSNNQKLVDDSISGHFKKSGDAVLISKTDLTAQYKQGLKGLSVVLKDYPKFFDNYIMNEMFRECFPFGSTSPLDHYLRLVVRFGLLRFMTTIQCANQNKLPDADAMVRTVQVFCRRYQHDSKFAATVNGCFNNSGWNDLHKIFRLLKA
jgi:lysine-N-methylase